MSFIAKRVYIKNRNAYVKSLKDKRFPSIIEFEDEDSENNPVTMNITSELFSGLNVSDIILEEDSIVYDFPEWSKREGEAFYGLKEEYIRECNKKYKANVGFTDGVKFMITSFDKNFTLDTLRLKVIRTNFTTVKFLERKIKNDLKLRENFLDDFKKRNITFAHSLCLHIVILTSDKMVLKTKRGNKTAYSQEKWSYSIEEQLSEVDFLTNGESPMVNWAKRALSEELGIDERDYSIDNLNIMSLFLEG